jgi:hypothetical protein
MYRDRSKFELSRTCNWRHKQGVRREEAQQSLGGFDDDPRTPDQVSTKPSGLSRTTTYIAHPPMIAAKATPLRMLNHRGANAVMSMWALAIDIRVSWLLQISVPFPNEILLELMLVEICDRNHTEPAKNAAARPPGLPCHCMMISSGDQRISP